MNEFTLSWAHNTRILSLWKDCTLRRDFLLRRFVNKVSSLSDNVLNFFYSVSSLRLWGMDTIQDGKIKVGHTFFMTIIHLNTYRTFWRHLAVRLSNAFLVKLILTSTSQAFLPCLLCLGQILLEIFMSPFSAAVKSPLVEVHKNITYFCAVAGPWTKFCRMC